MKVPTTGRVVIIDDSHEEALPLIHLLSHHGISSRYYNGDPDLLPLQPLEGVRIVFLDIEIGTYGQDNKSKVSKILGVLNRVIGASSTPFIIIAWTKHTELLEEVISKLPVPPLKTLNMEKIDCKDQEGNYRIDLISAKLTDIMQDIGSFQALLLWEEIIHQAANLTINDSYQLSNPQGNEWDENMQNILYNLAKAQQGTQLKEHVLGPALRAFTGIYFDYIEKSLLNNSLLEDNAGLNFKNKNRLSPEVMSSINSKLLFSKVESREVTPGNVYINDRTKLDLSLLVTKFEEIKAEWDTPQFIILEVTPTCDYAQDKWQLSRMLPGVFVPLKYLKNVKRADYVFISQLIQFNRDIGSLVFDLRYLTTRNFEDVAKMLPLFRIRHPFLVDIQSKVAGHIARPGYFAL
ncbi:hypothetical protein [Paenibacillus thiaminolyticus]|uniref:Uncharacterized protein n=1 Tax=Paenibacillus thiaminolyticus TaxID=49283 RepID=A0A3A3H3H1_PANTH|nr:hypothetical protein [Paenibacillus thiaminolyticus]RJG23744.1 hypothetical protein DQX05_11990 [Paenibacillus thiaminolyticus]